MTIEDGRIVGRSHYPGAGSEVWVYEVRGDTVVGISDRVTGKKP